MLNNDQYMRILRDTERQVAELMAFSEEARRILRQHESERAEIEKRWTEARDELLSALLPAMSADALLRAARLSGYAPFQEPGVIFKAVAARRAELERQQAEIEADGRFVNRELSCAPEVGTLTRKLAEFEEYARVFRDTLSRCEHPRLARLLETGYGTPAYTVPWWRASYYADWKAGDEIVERFPDKKDFASVAADYRQARADLAVYEAELRDLRKQIREIEALERKHAEIREHLATLEQRQLGALRDRLGRFIEDTGLDRLATRLQEEPEIELLAIRFEGLSRQKQYLAELSDQEALALNALAEDVAKARRTAAKWQRPKARTQEVTDEQMARFARPGDFRHRKRFGRIWHGQAAVYAFSTYEAGSLASDFLWWDLMTDGRIDGSFLPGVQRFHEQHPDYQYVRHGHDDSEAFAAAVAAGADDGSRDAMFDAS